MYNRQIQRGHWSIRIVLLLMSFLLGGCSVREAPLPGEGPQQVGLVQSLSWQEIYHATPVIAQRPLRQMPTAAATPDADALVETGLALYATNCAPCHQQNGEGLLNRFPALNQNAFVTNQSPQPLIRTVLYGRGIMPAFTPTLNDHEVAAILTYIRQGWNNDADAVYPEQIRRVAIDRE